MSFGQTLRAAREAKGITTSELAARTHLLVQIVEGLENEDFRRIPAPIYGRGFVKLYCETVGLEPKPLQAEFMTLYNLKKDAPEKVPPPPKPAPVAPPPPAPEPNRRPSSHHRRRSRNLHRNRRPSSHHHRRNPNQHRNPSSHRHHQRRNRHRNPNPSSHRRHRNPNRRRLRLLLDVRMASFSNKRMRRRKLRRSPRPPKSSMTRCPTCHLACSQRSSVSRPTRDVSPPWWSSRLSFWSSSRGESLNSTKRPAERKRRRRRQPKQFRRLLLRQRQLRRRRRRRRSRIPGKRPRRLTSSRRPRRPLRSPPPSQRD